MYQGKSNYVAINQDTFYCLDTIEPGRDNLKAKVKRQPPKRILAPTFCLSESPKAKRRKMSTHQDKENPLMDDNIVSMNAISSTLKIAAISTVYRRYLFPTYFSSRAMKKKRREGQFSLVPGT